MESIKEGQIKKKVVFLGLEDVIASGEVDARVNTPEIEKILSNLRELDNKKLINLYLVSGLQEKKALEIVSELKLGEFFRKENMLFATQKYINSKKEMDRKRYLVQLGEDPEFKDEYFKQEAIKKTLDRGKIQREDAILIGHDIWTDGFYTMRFSRIDFALMKESLSERHKLRKGKIKGLTYIRREWADFRKLLMGKFPKPDYRFLNKYTFEYLRGHLFAGTKIEPLIKRGGA